MRNKQLFGFTDTHDTICGPIDVTVNLKDDRPYEVFLNGEVSCTGLLQVTGRLISMALRSGIASKEIEKQVKAVKCYHTGTGKACGFYIAKSLNYADNVRRQIKPGNQKATELNRQEDNYADK